MSKSQPLPDPQAGPPSALCASCGYSLAGLAAPGTCPECASPFSESSLVLAGVPNRSSSQRSPRAIAWGAVIVGFALLAYTFPLLVMISGWLFLAALAGLAGTFVWLLATSRRERQGKERFIITPAGIQRVPFNFDPASTRLDSLFLPWNGADTVELTRVSAFWRRLRIGKAVAGRIDRPLLDAGIRCPDAMAPQVLHAIQESLRGHAISDVRFALLLASPPTSPGVPT